MIQLGSAGNIIAATDVHPSEVKWVHLSHSHSLRRLSTLGASARGLCAQPLLNAAFYDEFIFWLIETMQIF